MRALCATLAAFALAAPASGAHRPPRAARILSSFVAGTWICPELPDGRVIVRRDSCFKLGQP